MGMISQQQTTLAPASDDTTPPRDREAGAVLPATNLAALLDQFTQHVTQPQAFTVGDFASTVGALHGELAMLARQFGIGSNAQSTIDFDDIFPELAALDPAMAGIAAEEELEHACRELSR